MIYSHSSTPFDYSNSASPGLSVGSKVVLKRLAGAGKKAFKEI
jgi:hypothetical protein